MSSLRVIDGLFDSEEMILPPNETTEIARVNLQKAQSSVSFEFYSEADILGLEISLTMFPGGRPVSVAVEGINGVLSDQTDITDPETGDRGKVLYSNSVNPLDGTNPEAAHPVFCLFTIGLEGEAEAIVTVYSGDDNARVRVKGKVT